jgi:predicted RNA-binding protein with RPS1 domain
LRKEEKIMPKIDINIPIPQDMQVLYKTKAMGTDEYIKQIEDILTCDEHVSYDFVDENDSKTINIHLKATRKAFMILKQDLNYKVGYVKEEIVSFIKEHKLLKHITFSPSSIDIKDDKREIDIYFSVLIKKKKFQELKKEGIIEKNYNQNLI